MPHFTHRPVLFSSRHSHINAGDGVLAKMNDFTKVTAEEFRRFHTPERGSNVVALLKPYAKKLIVKGEQPPSGPRRQIGSHVRTQERDQRQWKKVERVDRVTLRSLFNKLSASNMDVILPKILTAAEAETEIGVPIGLMFQYCGMSAEYVPMYVAVCHAICARVKAAAAEVRKFAERFIALCPWALCPVDESSDYDAFCEYLKVKNSRVNVIRALLLSGVVDDRAASMANSCVDVLEDPDSEHCKDLAIRIMEILLRTRPGCVAPDVVGRLRICEKDGGSHGIQSMVRFKIQAVLNQRVSTGSKF